VIALQYSALGLRWSILFQRGTYLVTLLAFWLLCSLYAWAAGCKAQTTPTGTQDMALKRHIEVMVRSQFNVPQDYTITIGARKPSQIPGYDALSITLTRARKPLGSIFCSPPTARRWLAWRPSTWPRIPPSHRRSPDRHPRKSAAK